MPRGPYTGWILADQQSAAADAMQQRGMAGGVEHVDSPGQHRHRRTVDRQCRPMDGAVDAVRSVACFELLMLTLADASASKRNQDVGNQAPNAGGGRA